MSTKLKAGTATSGAVIDADTTGILELQTGSTPTTAVTIDASQNVGIGTANPIAKLDVYNSAAAAANNEIAKLRYTTSTTAGHSGDLNFANAAGTVIGKVSSVIESGGSGVALAFGTYASGSVSERMRIDSSGNLLVGTTSTSRTANIGIKNLISTSPDVVVVGSGTTNSDVAFEAYSTGASAFRFQVGYGGTIYATSTTITGISDQRLKENIVDLDDGLDAVMALKPRKFDWKAGKGKDIKGDRGFIAQEFEQVFPDMIEESKDPVPEGEKPYKAVNANIIPTLVKAIQELNAKVDAQAAEIAVLKGAK